MRSWDWVLLSGIPSSHPGGTGQLMRHLEKEILATQRYDGTIIYCPDKEELTDAQFEILVDIPKVVIFHPQMLGLSATLSLLSERRAKGLTTHIYLLDSFFFCRRSYNHIDSEFSPCLRCVGAANMNAADRMGCVPWPKTEDAAPTLIKALHEHVTAGSVHLYAQTKTQAALARQHFGSTAVIEVVGLWCDDWAEHFDAFLSDSSVRNQTSNFDIVYHGSRDMAKGLGWLLAVAAQTPNFSYLVPLDRGSANFSGPANVTIKPMRWDEGLFDAIKGATITVVPSLWSAPCEGALVKSIVTARAVAVAQNESAFASEIPEGVHLSLPADPVKAARGLSNAIHENWQPDLAVQKRWAKDFRDIGNALLSRLIPSVVLDSHT